VADGIHDAVQNARPAKLSARERALHVEDLHRLLTVLFAGFGSYLVSDSTQREYNHRSIWPREYLCLCVIIVGEFVTFGFKIR